MILNGLSVETLLLIFVIENFGNDHFWRRVFAVRILVVRIAIRCIALWKARRIAEAGWIEEGVRVVDTRIDVADLDAGAGSGPTASRSPRIHGIYDFVALAERWMIEGVVLSPGHHWCGCDRTQWCSIELHSHRVKRDVVLARNPCSGSVCSQPAFKIVPNSIQLGAVRSHGVAFEINFSTVCGLRSRVGAYRITFELNNGARVVDVLKAGERVGVSIRSRRAAHAKRNNTQADRREYQ